MSDEEFGYLTQRQGRDKAERSRKETWPVLTLLTSDRLCVRYLLLVIPAEAA